MSIASKLVPDVIRRRYALKFAIVLLVLGLLIAGLAVVGTVAVAEQVEDRVQGDQEALADHEARNVEQWNERNFQIVSATAADVDRAGNAEAAFAAAMEQEEGLHHLHHVDLETGAILDSTNGDLAGQPVTEADAVWPVVHLAVEMEGPEAVGEFFETPIPGTAHDGTPVLFYGVPVGETGEIVVVSFDMEQYADEMISPDGSVAYTVLNPDLGPREQALFEEAQDRGMVDGDEPIMNDGPVVIMDESGASFFQEYDTAGNGEAIDFDAIGLDAVYHQGIAAGPELQASVDDQYDDDEFLVSVAQITERSEFYVTMHTPESEGLVFVNTVREWGLIIGGVGLLLVVVIGGVLGRNTNRSMNRLIEKAERMENGDLDVEFDTHRVDSIGRLYNGFESMRDSLSEQIRTAEDAREEAEQARAETKQLNRQLEADADHFRNVLQQYADGDLTVRMDPKSDHDVMHEIASEFNDSVAEVERTVADLAQFSNEVATASEEVTASSEEVRAASQQVSESVQQISDGAKRQNETLQAVDQEMEGLSTTVEEIAASSNQVADIAARTAETGREGSESAQEAMDSFERLEDERQSVVDEFERLRSEVSQIDELIDTIAEIAEQTNMLALNANIEASRSEGGDDGGFGVVAQEVKELSTDAKNAADEIGERLERIQEQTERSAEEVENTSEEFERVSGKVHDAVEALDEIAEYAKETNAGVQEISAATEQQAAATEEVVAMVDEAATISEETTSEAENVAAAAEEQTTSMSEVSNSASALSQQASQLSEALDRFQVDIDDHDAGGLGVAGELGTPETEARTGLDIDESTGGRADSQNDEAGRADGPGHEAAEDDGVVDLGIGDDAHDTVEETADDDASGTVEDDTSGTVEDDGEPGEESEDANPEDVFTFGDER